MASTHRTICDRCGVLLVQEGKGEDSVSEPRISVQSNAVTPETREGELWDQWHGWDLCVPCGTEMVALMTAFATPDH